MRGLWKRFLRQAKSFVGLSIFSFLAACGGADAPDLKAVESGKPLEASKVALAITSVNQFAANGWYWNPAEGGTGFMFEAQGNRGFVAFFMYEEGSGKPIWYAADGQFVANTDSTFGFSGDLRIYRNGQPATSPIYKSPTSQSIGPVSVKFTGNEALASLPGGRIIAATRFNFAGLGTTPKSTQPETGWYWNPNEGGRGYGIEAQDDKLFMAMFHYAEDGSPTWNVVEGNIATGTVSAPFQRFTGGQTIASTYRSPAVPLSLGKYTVSFRSACAGQVQFAGVPAVTIRRYIIDGGALAYGAECRNPSVNWYDATRFAKLEPGDVVFGTTGSPRPGYDIFSIPMVAGVTYTIDLMGASSGAGTLADPALELQYVSTNVAQNDNWLPGSTDARIVFTPSVSSSSYYIYARSRNTSVGGSFVLSVSGVAQTLEAKPVPAVASYVGKYSGKLIGQQSGSLAFAVTSDGSVSGSLSRDASPGFQETLSGSIQLGGRVELASAGTNGLTFKGFASPLSGPLSGVWSGAAGGGSFLAERLVNNDIAALFGRLTLNYRFTGLSSNYVDTTTFSVANLSADGTSLANFATGSTTRLIGCSVVQIASPSATYLCLAQYTFSTSTELFVFNLSNRQIVNGVYEYCSAGTTSSACVSDLLTSPDGTVTGNITDATMGPLLGGFVDAASKVKLESGSSSLDDGVAIAEKVASKTLSYATTPESNLASPEAFSEYRKTFDALQQRVTRSQQAVERR